MTTLTFKNFGDFNAALAFDVIDRLKAVGSDARFGASNVSESAYVEVILNDDGDTVKLRFSGHTDRHGSDVTFRTDADATPIYSWTDTGEPTLFDDDGEAVEWASIRRSGSEDDYRAAGVSSDFAEFSHVAIAGDRYAALVDEALAFVARQKVES